ncbi:unnamed protein product, partial [Ectocarpus sp. 8 AP-2014]
MAKHSSRLLGALGTAAILSSVAAYSWSSSGCWEDGYADGYCNQENNNAECGYDGGDCCECTCVGSDCTRYPNFACIDPDAPCVDDDDITVDIVENCETSWMGDSRCDPENNNEICGYDLGDCCECTCVVPWDDEYDRVCADNGYGFACIDPTAPCVDDDDITVDLVENCGYVLRMGDGYCDDENNHEACGYDGGDCCECTCVRPPEDDNLDDDWHGACGSGFACIDPDAACVNDDDITVDIHHPDNDWACRNKFACVDPNAPCVDDDSVTVDILENCSWAAGIGDGWCSEDLNTPECAYDGGDCCSCTCQSYYDGTCTTFACIDPEAACVDDDDITVDMFVNCEYPIDVGDG